jgi:hypothetical protein
MWVIVHQRTIMPIALCKFVSTQQGRGLSIFPWKTSLAILAKRIASGAAGWMRPGCELGFAVVVVKVLL